MNRKFLAGSLLPALIAWPLQSQACSTCKCGDPTLTLMGTEKAYPGRLRLSSDYLSRSEEQGQAGLDRRRTEESRLSLNVAWSLDENHTFALQLPFVSKTVAHDNLARDEAEGMGDIDLSWRYVAWRDRPALPRQMAGLISGVRLPTSEEIRTSAGQLVDIDAQPDAGALAPNLGGWYAWYGYPWFFTASARYFHFAEGNQGFQPGDAIVASLRGQYAFSFGVAAQWGLDMRQSQKNAFDGSEDPNSGGFLAMSYIGLAARFGELLVDASVQLPTIKELNGEQIEDEALRFGITYDF